ncbi:LysR family transcriptional regulator [Lysinibacter sp. HNR]|uniref:LysR family transcriptional regulator n=1 Tax=Lysinibacter sp. HNR TaxID=3031408 RepID=UPI0024356D5D|nr:LysR family transcriptional regulator [Lysinibacter sp. HNR]WGD37861.1 LysR family transcriptional regulator [Lysinibacter sp. HNR]
MRIVHALSLTGSITGAAAHLHLSQPAVSQHLRKMEQRLGLAILEREGRGVRFTEVGEVLARHARVLNSELEAVVSDLSELAGLTRGRLRLGSFPTASAAIVPELFVGLREDFPGMVLSYRELEPREAIEEVRQGELDAAITFSYPGEGVGLVGESLPGLTVEHLWREEIYVALPAAHPLACREAVSLAELSSETWIAGCPRCRGHLISAAAQNGFVPHIGHETDNIVAVMNLVSASLAVSLIPRLALEGIQVIPDQVLILPLVEDSHRVISFVSPQSVVDVPAVAAARKSLREMDSIYWSLLDAPHA